MIQLYDTYFFYTIKNHQITDEKRLTGIKYIRVIKRDSLVTQIKKILTIHYSRGILRE